MRTMRATAVPRRGDIPRLLAQSSVFSLRDFWKFSSVSKKLLALRDDKTCLGSVCLTNFKFESVRKEVAEGLFGCIKCDDVTGLRQLLSLNGVDGRCPFLLRQLLEHAPNSVKCRAFLATEREATLSCSAEVSAEALSKMSRETLKELLGSGILKPDLWLPPLTDDRLGRKVIRPLLISFLREGNLDCAEVLLDAGARVDLWEWESRSSNNTEEDGLVDLLEFRAGGGPLHAVVSFLGEGRLFGKKIVRGGAHSLPFPREDRERGLALLERLAAKAKKAGCHDWTADVAVRGMFGKVTMYSGTATGLACVHRDPDAVRVLLRHSVGVGNPHAMPSMSSSLPFDSVGEIPRTHELMSPLELDEKSAEILGLHAETGVEMHLTSRLTGHSVLSLACSLGMEKTARFLLDHRDRVVTFGGNRRGNRGGGRFHLPLVEACLSDRAPKSLISLLLERKEDPNEVGLYGGGDEYHGEVLVSPLQAACLSLGDKVRTAQIAELLISYGARHPPPSLHDLNEHPNSPPPLSVFSPVHGAIQLQNTALLKILCSEKGGCDPNGPGSVFHFEEDIVNPQFPLEFLLKNARIVYSRDELRYRFGGFYPSLKCEIRFYPSDPDTTDRHVLELVRVLTAVGADISGTTEKGETVLSLSCLRGLLRTSEFLLQSGASVGGQNEESRGLQLSLFCAIENVLEDLVRLLLQHGADPNATQRPRDVVEEDSAGTSVRECEKSLVPLQALVLKCAHHFKGQGDLPAELSVLTSQIARLLLDSGARCPPFRSSISAAPHAPASAAAAAAAASSGVADPRSGWKTSSWLRVCADRGGLTRMLVARTGSDELGVGSDGLIQGSDELGEGSDGLSRGSDELSEGSDGLRETLHLPLAYALWGRRREGSWWGENPIRGAWEDERIQWKIVQTLLGAGADVSLLSTCTDPPPSFDPRGTPAWLEGLIREVPEARSDLLVDIIRSVPFSTLQHAQKEKQAPTGGSDSESSHGDQSVDPGGDGEGEMDGENDEEEASVDEEGGEDGSVQEDEESEGRFCPGRAASGGGPRRFPRVDSPLGAAVMVGWVEGVDALLDREVDVCIPAAFGKAAALCSCVYIAICHSFWGIVRKLVEKGGRLTPDKVENLHPDRFPPEAADLREKLGVISEEGETEEGGQILTAN
uniref:Uncharacterized protein n=1 Tax=Chromera velia CCMP2878 TaxID=1169474 RepID=A0A0G4FX60_9ALVE|eukprot:Cvel_19123.t1-p1 / transcript=Cvel_19123.t1 / gene=Cvel_19123 / organism=Chromera_velia_CCMP2878 / gene_product=hypothetical protein / transcript_product=hypothetical protein / location=Cvel_scaffold1625:4855-9377(+) / protein_length=1155 / sequence_SO=supercontig / SO=protein_coding / is_pseudo=false